MVESVLPKNLLNRISFADLLRIEDAYNSHSVSSRYTGHKKTSQEHLYLQLCKLFSNEGTIVIIILLFYNLYLKK